MRLGRSQPASLIDTLVFRTLRPAGEHPRPGDDREAAAPRGRTGRQPGPASWRRPQASASQDGSR